MTMSYREQLLHPNWQRKRLEMLNEADFACSCCYDKESTLHVHHKRYVKGRMAWEYPNEELAVLCETCHETEHERLANFGRAVAAMPLDGGPWSFNEFVAIACGWAEDDLEEGEALKLAGGVGYLQSFQVGKLAREMVWDGGWPTEAIAALSAVTPDDEFLSGLAVLCAEARKRSEARREASGL